jgi:hypothetical protein
VVYASSSSALATGSALTYNGTSFGVGSSSYGDAGTITASIGVPSTTVGGLQLWSTTSATHYVNFGDGTSGSDTYRGYVGYAHASDAMLFGTSTAERMRLTSTGLGIGTSSPSARLDVTTSTAGFATILTNTNGASDSNGLYVKSGTGSTEYNLRLSNTSGSADFMVVKGNGNVGIGTSSPAYKLDLYTTAQFSGRWGNATRAGHFYADSGGVGIFDTPAYGGEGMYFHAGSNYIRFITNSAERMTLDSAGRLLVAKTASDIATAGFQTDQTGETNVTVNGSECMNINRNTNDGDLIRFRQDNTIEGSISVSGTTVSYNGGHLSRWAQTTTAKDESIVKGTVLSNLDAMNVYTDAEGNPVTNEQLNKVKVSDTEGDVNVAGVFVNWTFDDQHNVDEINMAMTGDMIIRIAQGVTVVRGDLLMSAGDGTAKPQGDDIVRSKTVAKVTSNHITCTYADGSYCVPCVLMAC